jgi:hypothetical protein
MTTSTFTCGYSVADATATQNWVTALHTALTTVGLVQTSDTGQVTPSAIAAPTTANVAVGYTVYRFNDAAQSTYPLFLKVEFGSQGHATAASGYPGVWLTVGTGSNGSGTITGTLFARTQLGITATGTTATGSASTFTGRASGGTDWVSLFPWTNLMASANGVGATAYRAPFFHIERTNSGTGIVMCTTAAVTSAGANSVLSSGVSASGPWVSFINHATGTNTTGLAPVTVPYSIAGSTLGVSTSLAAGTIGPVFPWVCIAPGLAPSQAVSILSYPGGDTPGSTFTTSLGGTTRTYMPIPLSDAQNMFGLAVKAEPGATSVTVSRYVGAAIRWE